MLEDEVGFANLMKRRGFPDALQAGQVVPTGEADTTHDEGYLEALQHLSEMRGKLDGGYDVEVGDISEAMRLLRNVRKRKMQPPHPDQRTATPLIVDL